MREGVKKRLNIVAEDLQSSTTRITTILQDLLREGKINNAEAACLSALVEYADKSMLQQMAGPFGVEGLHSLKQDE